MSLLAFRPTPSTYQLRWFAGLWFPAFCGVIGGIASRQGAGRVGALIWLVGVLLGVAGLARPRIIRPVYTVLLRLTFPVGWLVSHLILAAVYFLAITPFGRLVGLFHDPMGRRFDRGVKSYWYPREVSEDPRRYLRQF